MPVNEITKNFSENLKIYMEKAHMMQKDLAKLVGVSPAAVNGWAKGEAIPRMDRVDRICAVLGCSRSDLLEAHSPDEAAANAKRIILYSKYDALLDAAEGLKEKDLDVVINLVRVLKESYKDV